jgi:hypothetical protein
MPELWWRFCSATRQAFEELEGGQFPGERPGEHEDPASPGRSSCPRAILSRHQSNTVRKTVVATVIMQTVAALMLAEGIFFGLLAYVLFRKKSTRLALCHRAWGEVIGVNEHSGGEGPTKHPVIRYKAMSGEEVTFESKFGRSNWQVKPGDRLEILVNPNNPMDAEVVSFMAQWALPVIFAIVAAGSIIGGPLVYLFLK